MSILTKEGIQKILNDDWLLMDDCEGLENCTVIKELARMALAAMDSEKLALENFRSAMEGIGHIHRTLEETFGGLHGTHVEPDVLAECKAICDAIYAAYRHAQPAPVVPNGLRLALSNAGIAAPESDEMLAATCEKHIQALVTWVKDRKPFQSAPVVPSFEEWLSAANRKPLGWVKDAMREAYDACRAAMLQAGNSPVIPDGWTCNDKANAALMMLDRIETADPVDDDRIDGIKRIVRELAAAPHDTPALNSVQSVVTVPGKWIPVSEQMPEMGEKQRYVLAADFKNNYWPNIPNTQVGVYGDWFDDGNPTWDDGDGEDLHLKEVTHWMPLPAGPQGVKP